MPEVSEDSVKLKGALRLIAVLFGVVAVAIAVTAGLVHMWRLQTVPQDAARSLAQRPPLSLETAPRLGLAAYREEKDRLLHGYAWIDREKGLARIPLKDAMQAMAQQAGPAAQRERP